MLKLLVVSAMIANMAAGNVLQDFSRGNAKFSAGVYTEMLKENKGNFLVCPISVEIAMAMTGAGAKGNTALEISKGLGLPEDPAKVEELFKELSPKLKGNEFYALNAANRIFLMTGYPISSTFREKSVSVFNAGIDNINFAKNIDAARTINEWVESKTNNKIQNLVAPDYLSADTRLVLVNAIYFKGKWVNPFEEYMTRKLPFYTLGGAAKEVDTMSVTADFRYYENQELDAKFLEMPFQGDDISMVIVLPNKRDGLKALEQKLDKVFVEQPYKYEHVAVQIPKFTIETEIQFKDILKELGVKDAFNQFSANFSGITDSPDQRLYIDRVVQKTFLNMTEGGVEAAAATAVVHHLGLSASHLPPTTAYFIADHSFVYNLIHTKLNTILFTGRYAMAEA